MANYTRKAILHTFGEMLEEMPFEKITISALVLRCEISSNTFYYHFHDIYDLLDTWLNEQKDKYLKDVQNLDNWAEPLKAMLHNIQDNPKRVRHLFDSVSLNRLENYVFTSVDEWFYDIVRRRSDELGCISEEKARKIAGFYCYVSIGFLTKFIWNHMEADVDASVDELMELFYGVWTYITENDTGKGQSMF